MLPYSLHTTGNTTNEYTTDCMGLREWHGLPWSLLVPGGLIYDETTQDLSFLLGCWVSVCSVLSPLPDSGPQNLEIKPEALPSSVTPAYVTTVVSPSQIYIQLAKSELELASLLDDMYAYYTTSKVLPLATVHQGAICAAPYSVDGSWYRVKVVSVKPVSERESLGEEESHV